MRFNGPGKQHFIVICLRQFFFVRSVDDERDGDDDDTLD